MGGYKVLGTTTDVDHCECCGRADLRKTVMMVTLDTDGTPDGETGYYGTSCAARLVGTTAKKITDQAHAGDKVRAAAEEVARRTLDRYEDVDGLFPMDAVKRYINANWRYTSGMTGDEILAELRGMVADARAVLGLDTPTEDTPDTEETIVETPALFSITEVSQLKGQTDVFGQVADALAETPAPAPVAVETPAATLPGDGTLFALRVTDTPDHTAGALFGLGI